MNLVDRPENCKSLCGILQLLQDSHLDNFPLQTLKLDWAAFHSVTFPLNCLDFQSNQYNKLVPVLSRFCNGLYNEVKADYIITVDLKPINAIYMYVERALSPFGERVSTAQSQMQ